MHSNFNTPVLLIIFNRVDTTKQVLDILRTVKVKHLFVAADGPRPGNPSDEKRCAEVRAFVMKAVDWDCKIETLFRDNNLGCGEGPADAITWFFSKVEEGIILEDDCLPSISFFRFCEEILERYRNDPRIMVVSGSPIKRPPSTPGDYFFSSFGATWGWATWRRAWKLFDYRVSDWKLAEVRQHVLSKFSFESHRQDFIKHFDATLNDPEISWWDFQWLFARLKNDGLTVIPKKSLVRNIGFGPDATHTFEEFSPDAFLKREEIRFPLKHPKTVSVSPSFDRDFLKPRTTFMDKVKYRIRLWRYANKKKAN